MTGELYVGDRAAQHPRPRRRDRSGPAPVDSRPFREGLSTALAAPTALTASLFRLRCGAALGFEAAPDGAARLSGLLIGTELADALHRHGLIGSGPLRSVRLIRRWRPRAAL